MAFKFKNMQEFIRGVIEPHVIALKTNFSSWHDYFKDLLDKLRKHSDDEDDKIRNDLKTGEIDPIMANTFISKNGNRNNTGYKLLNNQDLAEIFAKIKQVEVITSGSGNTVSNVAGSLDEANNRILLTQTKYNVTYCTYCTHCSLLVTTGYLGERCRDGQRPNGDNCAQLNCITQYCRYCDCDCQCDCDCHFCEN